MLVEELFEVVVYCCYFFCFVEHEAEVDCWFAHRGGYGEYYG